MTYFELYEYLEHELEGKLNHPKNKTTKIVCKLIYTLAAIIDATLEVNNEIIFTQDLYDSTFSLKDLYKNNIKDIDEYDIQMLDFLYDKLKDQSKIKFINLEDCKDNNEESNDQDNLVKMDEYQEKISKYKNKIRSLKKEVSELNETTKKLHSKEEIDYYVSLVGTLENEISELNDTIANLSLDNSNLRIDNRKLSTRVKTNEVLYTDTLNKLKKDLALKTLIEKKYNSFLEDQRMISEIDERITEYIVLYELTINDIYSMIHQDYPQATKLDVLSSLNRIKNKYSVYQNNVYNFEKAYGIEMNSYDNYYISNSSDTLDIIVLSDMHIDDCVDSSLHNLNLIYDYAARNDIRLILNLGDFIDGHFTKFDNKLEQFKYNEELVSKIIEKLPKDEMILNLLLGGNHDRLVMNQGIDIINRVANERLDYASLNYDHSVLKIGPSIIGLHHMNKRFSNDFIENTSCNNNLLKNYLEKYYERKNILRNNVHIDMLGHFHVSKISLTNCYITVPSLNKDHINNGAFRLRFYFDSNNNIIETVLIPLIIDDKVIESVSINYQKVK